MQGTTQAENPKHQLGVAYRQLASFLEMHDPARDWGGLTVVQTDEQQEGAVRGQGCENTSPFTHPSPELPEHQLPWSNLTCLGEPSISRVIAHHVQGDFIAHHFQHIISRVIAHHVQGDFIAHHFQHIMSRVIAHHVQGDCTCCAGG